MEGQNKPADLKFEHALGSPGRLLKHRFGGPTPKVSDSVGYGEGQSTGISHKFSGDSDAAGPGSTLWELQVQATSSSNSIYQLDDVEQINLPEPLFHRL